MARDLDFPEKVQFLFEPHQWKVLYGGRYGIKSWSIARALLLRLAQKKQRWLCARELQKSIQESVHHLLATQIELMGMGALYEVQNTRILGVNGSEFIFSGLKSNVTAIKSMEGLDGCWVEEAEKVSKPSWEVLIPTIIRKAGAEMWVSFNPDEEGDPTSQMFLVNPIPGAKVVETNWRDNPWLSDEARKYIDYLKRVDPDAAEHVIEGHFRKGGAAEVFHGKWIVDSFTPVPESEDPATSWQGPYHGADWGFSQDPTTLVRCWVRNIGTEDEPRSELYIEHESYVVGLESDSIADRWRKDVPDIEDCVIRADNSRPETINHVTRRGHLRVVAANKWPGSVEDGIKFLRSYERIIIHPRCRYAELEAKTYRHKVDALTGDVLTAIVDKQNHIWDAVRYAIEPAIRRKRSIYEVV